MTHPSQHMIRLRVDPQTVHVSRGRTVMATGLDGWMHGEPQHGLYVHQTRVCSRYRIRINGELPLPVAASNVQQHSWLGYYILVPPGAEPVEQDLGSGMLSQHSEETLELRVSRMVGRGMHEDLDLANHSNRTTRFQLQLELDADFLDYVEQQGPLRHHGQTTRIFGGNVLHFQHTASHRSDVDGRERHIDRRLSIRFINASTAPRMEGDRVVFDVELPPGGRWHTCLQWVPVIDGHALEPACGCYEFTGIHNVLDRQQQEALEMETSFRAHEPGLEGPEVIPVLEQARRDLVALRLLDDTEHDDAWVVAAGLPLYAAIFGRDLLTAGWQAALLGPEWMHGALDVLARMQGTTVDDWRDERPGRMLHEAHTGPLAALGMVPRDRYFGSVTTSGFYPVALSELWHWTGDRALVRHYVDNALRALQWLDTDARSDDHGFYWYQTRSPMGTSHQAWKDAPGAVVDEDGTPIPPPIATCEEQGFVYAAKQMLAEVLFWMGERDLARRLIKEASELRKRFNDVFWMEDRQFVPFGLGPGGKPIRAIVSNAGHCLATGIIEKERVPKVAKRLFADDLFSGWGIRTLSTENPAFNPYSYHRGSVWPVEQGTFALGMMRFGLHDRVEQLCRAVFDAAAVFEFHRLPELFGGQARDSAHPFPALYPQANAPQAWSASTVYCLLQAMLGIYPYAPLGTLFVDPHLPAWLPSITVHNLRVGQATVTLRFRRGRNGVTAYDVVEQRGRLRVLRQPSPWSLSASVPERILDVVWR